MKGAIYHNFNSLITISNDLPIPHPSPDGVVIQIIATGVCRSDWHGWKGHDNDVKNWIQKFGTPFVPGHEASGIIVNVGSDVKFFSVGDRVSIPFILSCGACRECSRERNRPTVCEDQHQPGFTMWGTFAEYCHITRADRNLKRIPSNVSFVEAAALGCRLCGGSNDVGISAKKTVAIFGCGGLGLSCVAVASAFGAKRIIAVDISLDALLKARDLGASEIIHAALLKPNESRVWDDSNIEENDVYRQIMDLTEGIGADLTFDAGGFEKTCLDAVWTCRRGGTMVQVGLPSTQINLPMARIAGREIEIKGSHGFSSVEDDSGISALDHILQLVASGKLQPKKLVDREVTLEAGIRALMDMDKVSPLGIVMITSFDEEERNSKL